jgi:hypothetical protein
MTAKKASGKERAGKTRAHVVEAQAFVLKDDQGKTKAILGLDKSGKPTLQLLGEKGCGVTIGFGESGTVPSVQVFRSGDVKAILVANDEQSMLELRDAGNKVGARLITSNGQGDESGHAYLGLHDQAGTARTVIADGDLVLYDQAGEAILMLPNESGNGQC